MMDELLDLRSDADVDALMARIQARVAPPPPPVAPHRSDAPDGPAAEGGALAAFVAAQEGLAAAMLRALRAVAESLEELDADASRPADAPAAARRARDRRPAVRRRAPSAAAPRRGVKA